MKQWHKVVKGPKYHGSPIKMVEEVSAGEKVWMK